MMDRLIRAFDSGQATGRAAFQASVLVYGESTARECGALLISVGRRLADGTDFEIDTPSEGHADCLSLMIEIGGQFAKDRMWVIVTGLVVTVKFFREKL